MNEEEHKLFSQSLNTFYKLKREYEVENSKQKRNIMKKEDLSWKEKRTEYKKLKRKCINCKRPVGTIFSNLYNPEENGRKLMAVCGDHSNPCPFNIVINLGETSTFPQEIQDLEEDIQDLKSKIINDKNDQIFGYISSKEAVEKFDDIKENLNITISSYEASIAAFLEVTDSPVINEAIKKLQIEMYSIIHKIKELVKQFEGSRNISFIKDVVELYVNQLSPCLNKLNHLQYAYCAVEYESDDDTFHLIQKKNTLAQLETNYSKHQIGVVSLQTGLQEKPKRAKKTSNTNFSLEAQMVTAPAQEPNQPILDIEEQGENEQQGQGENEQQEQGENEQQEQGENEEQGEE